MIRIATKFDIPQLVNLMRQYSKHSPVEELRHNQNPSHVEQLLHTLIAGMGIIWVAEGGEDGDELVGMLIAMRQPNIWNPRVLLLQELAFWVEEDYRHTSIGYRLLRAYEDWAQDEYDRGVIVGWTISKLADSEFEPERKGYKLIESTYLKE